MSDWLWASCNDTPVWEEHNEAQYFLYSETLIRKLVWVFDATFLKTVIVVLGKHRSLSSVCCLKSKECPDIQWDDYQKSLFPHTYSSLHDKDTLLPLPRSWNLDVLQWGLFTAWLLTLLWPCTSIALAQLLCNTYPEGVVASGERPKWECAYGRLSWAWRPQGLPSQWGKQANHISEQPETPDGSEQGQRVNLTQAWFYSSCGLSHIAFLIHSNLTGAGYGTSMVIILSIVSIRKPGTGADGCGTASNL